LGLVSGQHLLCLHLNYRKKCRTLEGEPGMIQLMYLYT
jgi:hypothetical protein